VWDATFSPNEDHVAISSWSYRGTSGGAARVWRIRDGRAAGPPVVHRELILGIAFSPDGQRILTWSQDRTARLWDVATGAPLMTPSTHPRAVLAAGFEGDMALTFDGERVRAWDARGRESHVFPPAWRAEGETLGLHYVVRGGSSLTWNTWTPTPVRFVDADGRATTIALPTGEICHSAALSPDGHLIAVGLVPKYLKDARAVTYDSRSGAPVRDFPHGHDVTDITFSGDGNRLTTWGEGVARTWDVRAGKEMDTAIAATGEGHVTSPDGKTLVTFGPVTRLWDTSTHTPLTAPITIDHAIDRAVFSRDSSRLLLSGWNGATLMDSRGRQLLYLWRTDDREGNNHHSLPAREASALVHWESDGTVRVWNLSPASVPLDEHLDDRFALLTGARFDDFDGLQLLPAEEWRRAKTGSDEQAGNRPPALSKR
jgi:WD40 repeat protein